MGRFIQLVMGPAGVGKSTYCHHIQEHCNASKRSMKVANLDPAADYYKYKASFDIKDLVCLEEAMEQYGFGPNGGLVYCMEYLLQNCEWLKDQLDSFGDDDYVILDCPGQVDLYSHLPIMRNLAEQLQQWGYRVCGVYILDALYCLEPAKFISGCMLSLSCMMQLGLPHINVITKCDLADKSEIDSILRSEGAWMIQSMNRQSNGKLHKLTEAVSSVVDDFMLVSFVCMDPTDEDTLDEVLAHCDHCVQYGEDAEPKDPDEMNMVGMSGGYGDNDSDWNSNINADMLSDLYGQEGEGMNNTNDMNIEGHNGHGHASRSMEGQPDSLETMMTDRLRRMGM